MAFQDGINELNVWLYNALGRCSTLAAENGDLTKALADKTAELEASQQHVTELIARADEQDNLRTASQVAPSFIDQINDTDARLQHSLPNGNGTLHDWGRHSPNSDPGSFTSLPEPQDL